MTELKAVEAVAAAELARRARGHLHVIAGGAEYLHPEVSAVEAGATIPEGAQVRLCREARCLS